MRKPKIPCYNCLIIISLARTRYSSFMIITDNIALDGKRRMIGAHGILLRRWKPKHVHIVMPTGSFRWCWTMIPQNQVGRMYVLFENARLWIIFTDIPNIHACGFPFIILFRHVHDAIQTWKEQKSKVYAIIFIRMLIALMTGCDSLHCLRASQHFQCRAYVMMM